MPTQTRRDGKSSASDKQTLAVMKLAVNAIDLIEQGSRSDTSTEMLLRALQLYKEDRLGQVIRRDAVSGEVLLELLSLKIDDMPINGASKEVFAYKGVLYVGEAYNLFTIRRDQSSKSNKRLKTAMLEMGLPPQLDVIEAGWRPPYWDDPKFMACLEVPIEDVFIRSEFTQMYKEELRVQYVEEWPTRRALMTWRWLHPRFLSRELRAAGVHLGMIVPPDWKPSASAKPSPQSEA